MTDTQIISRIYKSHHPNSVGNHAECWRGWQCVQHCRIRPSHQPDLSQRTSSWLQKASCLPFKENTNQAHLSCYYKRPLVAPPASSRRLGQVECRGSWEETADCWAPGVCPSLGRRQEIQRMQVSLRELERRNSALRVFSSGCIPSLLVYITFDC